MEPAVDKLESLFQKAETDLNYISLKLESEFSQQFFDSGQDELNPIRLLERLNQVRKQFKSLLEEAAKTTAQQQEIKSALKHQLLSCHSLLHKSQECSGLTVSQIGADEEHLLTSIIQSKTATTTSGQITSDSEDKENKAVTKAENSQQPEAVSKPVCRNHKEFLPISEQEFLAVSDLVRGRAKLHDVNKYDIVDIAGSNNIYRRMRMVKNDRLQKINVYEVLNNHFKKNENSTSITPQEMTKMGLKISGATGEAKLKVLRALKIIVINNKGAVKMATK